MKRRFLPLSLLLAIIVLTQASAFAQTTGNDGKYVPRNSSMKTAQEFMKGLRANQQTGLIDPEWLVEGATTSTKDDNTLNWKSLGPDNYGSLTRAIIYDKRDASGNTVIVGTLGGNIFKTTNGGITWKLVGNINMMASCMVQTADNTIYVGTGDGRNNYEFNGLSNYDYTTSFVGNGIYKSTDGINFSQIASTNPANDEGWTFVNDLAVMGNRIYAATNGGLRYSDNGGESWSFVENIDHVEASAIKVNGEKAIAVVGTNVYVKNGDSFVITNETLPTADVNKIVAIAPSDANYMYVCYLTATYGTGTIYYTSDGGENWSEALPASSTYDIFGSRGIIDNAIAVYPNDPQRLLIGGQNLWKLENISGSGYYYPMCISSSGHPLSTLPEDGTRFSYCHLGVQNIVFNPNNVGEFYVGTEGGVFKGEYYEGAYSYKNTNRYFETEEIHTSVARMFNVGISGSLNKVIGGNLDHGSIFIEGAGNINNTTTGTPILPNYNVNTGAYSSYGDYTTDWAAGPSAISTIDPNVMFLTTTGNTSTPIYRTENGGDDYDFSNFNADADGNAIITNANAFRTPILLFENYYDYYTPNTAKFYNNDTINYPAGTVVTIRSNNRNYPFDYELESNLAIGDSIEVQDIISAKLFIGIEKKVYMSLNPLRFDEKSEWYNICTVDGIPTAMAVDNDGDILFVGTNSGNLYRIDNLLLAVDANTASSDSLEYVIENLAITDAFNGQVITSIAVNPNNADEVIVTLGNYGNDNYVYRSINATSDNPTFTSIQGTLPKMPVYSSIIEMTEGNYIIGTEQGIYVGNGSTWTKDNTVANVPVMEIKQQTMEKHEDEYVYLVDEVGDTTVITYKGIENEGMIYAATYGRGLYKCDTYLPSDVDIEEHEASSLSALNVTVYPNPVVTDATVKFELNSTSTVSYQIYDLTGRLIANTVLGIYPEGCNQFTINTNNMSTGSYIIRVQAGSSVSTSKILIF